MSSRMSTCTAMRGPSGAREASSRSSGRTPRPNPASVLAPAVGGRRGRGGGGRPAGGGAVRPEGPGDGAVVADELRLDHVHRRRADETGHEEIRRALVEHLGPVDLLEDSAA